MSNRPLSFTSDYMEGAHPAILERLSAHNLIKTPGYGTDGISASAKDRIRAACGCPDAGVWFLVGGTQANAVVLGALLKPWEGVIAADSGHVSVHEAGAIEAGGHKVLALPGVDGKLSAKAVDAAASAFEGDGNREHMVHPGAVYISQPTEFGTLYTLAELDALHRVCRAHGLKLYADGARLAYALAAPVNDVTLTDLARLCDAFYIGGTKCGALLGEAVVFPDPNVVDHFFTQIKQKGALLAKGWVAGMQFDVLFENGLYLHIGEKAVAQADRIRAALKAAGFETAIDAPTNQIFPVLSDADLAALDGRLEASFWERLPDGRTVVRLATSWATSDADVDALIELIAELRR